MNSARQCVVAMSMVSLLSCFVTSAIADTPLPKPTIRTIWSANRQFCAVMDPNKKTTTVYRVGEGDARTKTWEMPGWFRVAALADDGERLVTGYDGMNLLALNHKKDEVMLSFFRKGELLRAVTLDQLIKDPSSLKRTVSHFHWGGYRGIDAKGHYLVETVEGRTIAFDMATGLPVDSH